MIVRRLSVAVFKFAITAECSIFLAHWAQIYVDESKSLHNAK